MQVKLFPDFPSSLLLVSKENTSGKFSKPTAAFPGGGGNRAVAGIN